jgi:hypothetical protein
VSRTVDGGPSVPVAQSHGTRFESGPEPRLRRPLHTLRVPGRPVNGLLEFTWALRIHLNNTPQGAVPGRDGSQRVLLAVASTALRREAGRPGRVLDAKRDALTSRPGQVTRPRQATAAFPRRDRSCRWAAVQRATVNACQVYARNNASCRLPGEPSLSPFGYLRGMSSCPAGTRDCWRRGLADITL